MVTANAFRGLRYNPAVAGDPADLTAPPADAATGSLAAAQTPNRPPATNPYNITRLLTAAIPPIPTGTPPTGTPTGTSPGTPIGRPDAAPGRAAHAAELLRDWLAARVLVADAHPSLYAYEQTSQTGGASTRQRGVIASVPLDPAGRRILPHEATLPAVVQERRALLEALHLNLSPIFALYQGGGRASPASAAMTTGPPQTAYTDETGVTHRLWPVTDPALIARWQAAVAGLDLLIADGHHRYRAALAHQARVRDACPHHPAGPWDEVLMFLVDADTDGPTLDAVHRLCAGVDPGALAAAATAWADVHQLPTPHGHRPTALDLQRHLRAAPTDRPAFGLLGRERAWLLVARQPAGDTLDVEAVHQRLLTFRGGVTDPARQIGYEPDPARADHLVATEAADAAVLLRPPPISGVLRAARAGRTLPQKATRFLPKPRDGMVLRPLEPL